MKHKTIFRLMIKAIGVWISCTALGMVISVVGRLIFTTAAMRSGEVQWYDFSYLFGYVAQLGLGLYLFFGGKWIVDKAIPSNRPYCHECGYDLTGAIGNVCNECGTPFRAPDIATLHE